MDKYKQDFSEISNTIVMAYHHYEIWWLYKHERSKYVKILNNYLGFFASSISAHFIAMLLAISRLVDNNYLSIPTLFTNLKSEGIFKSNEIQTIDSKLRSLKHIIKGIRIIRSNVFAHKSEKIDSDKAFKMAGLKYDDFKEIIFSLGEIFNIMSEANGLNKLGFWINSSKLDTEKMLNDLMKIDNSR